MIIHVAQLARGSVRYQEELPPEVLDVEGDKFIRARHPIRADVTAEIVSNQIIARGVVETQLDLLCVSCAEFFSTEIRISSFLRAYEIHPELDRIDLTEDIREEILLEVPHYPRGERDEFDRCKLCGRQFGAEPDDNGPPDPPPDVWGPLDRLNL